MEEKSFEELFTRLNEKQKTFCGSQIYNRQFFTSLKDHKEVSLTTIPLNLYYLTC